MKMCEFCGTQNDKYYYKFIATFEAFIILKNPNIIFHDEDHQIIVFNDGKQIEYSHKLDEEMAVIINSIIPHIFCSNACERLFEEERQPKITDFAKSEINNRVATFDKFFPIVTPLDAVRHHDDDCIKCGNKFPNVEKIYYASHFIKFKKIPAKFREFQLDTSEFDIAFSDLNKNHTNGFVYAYKLDLNYKELKFCSNECAFDYCSKYELISHFRSNLDFGQMRVISPHMKEINITMNNKYLLRPLPFPQK